MHTHTHTPVGAAVLQAVPLALRVAEHHQALPHDVHLFRVKVRVRLRVKVRVRVRVLPSLVRKGR